MGSSFRVRTTPGFWPCLALAILILPLPWLGAILLSSTVHELSHLAAIAVSGVPVRGVRLGADGVYLETGHLSPGQSIFCSLAGPLGALLLLFSARWLPRTALCALIQSAYHLLPLRPLDGGRALEGLISQLPLQHSGRVCAAVEGAFLLLLGVGGLYLSAAVGSGFLPLLVSVAIIFRVCREKYLANGGRTGYNRFSN